MGNKHSLPIGTRIEFNIAQGLDVGIAIIKEADIDPDDNHLHYKLEVIEGSQADMHRNDKGELWVNDFEVKPTR